MLSLAVFYFVFLGTEYLFDNRMALYTDPSGVVLAQSYILGVSVFGFLAYSLIEKWKSKSGNPTAFKAAGILLAGAGDRRICTAVCRDRVLGTIGQRVFSVPDTGISGQQDTLPGGTAA